MLLSIPLYVLYKAHYVYSFWAVFSIHVFNLFFLYYFFVFFSFCICLFFCRCATFFGHSVSFESGFVLFERMFCHLAVHVHCVFCLLCLF